MLLLPDPHGALPYRSWLRHFQKTALSWVCRAINFHKLNTLFNQQIKKQIILPPCPHPVPLVPPPVAVHPPGSWAHRFIQPVFERDVNGITWHKLFWVFHWLCVRFICAVGLVHSCCIGLIMWLHHSLSISLWMGTWIVSYLGLILKYKLHYTESAKNV